MRCTISVGLDWTDEEVMGRREDKEKGSRGEGEGGRGKWRGGRGKRV